jgi:hypothetical protein
VFTPWHSFTSSNVASARYDDATKQLEVRFVGGGVYRYSGVPASRWAGLCAAPSKGGYLAAFIKDSYPYMQIG